MTEKPPTRANSLKFALAFALREVRLAKHRLGLSEETHYQIADKVVDYLTKDGRWPELNDTPELRRLSDGSTDKRTR